MKPKTSALFSLFFAFLLAFASVPANRMPALAVSQNAISTSPQVFLPTIQNGFSFDWAMVGANPQRTSWSPEEVSGNLTVSWYRPIEAYISQNVQIIASNGLLYISTSRGLYALNAQNGQIVWRFDTQLPLGNSPTVVGGVVYVGGYDRKLHALNALNGQHLWAFEGAKAGYSTNPVVIDGKVLLGNRDGAFYAIGAHGSQDQGELLWKYQTGGLIDLSAAYKDGVVYFASDDNYAYALRIDNGQLVWKSNKLPGDGYHSYWPVIYKDKVIFSAASGYRANLDPGTRDFVDLANNPYEKYISMERDDLFIGVDEWPSISGAPLKSLLDEWQCGAQPRENFGIFRG